MRPTRRDLERRTDALDPAHDPSGVDEIIIRDSLVSDSNADPELFARTRVWRDNAGNWHSERTELRDHRDRP